MRKSIWIFLFIICIVIAFFIMNSLFFFSPVVFEKIAGLENRSWFEYRRPLRVEYEYWKTPKNIWSQNEEEIRFIIKELGNSKEAAFEDYAGSGRHVWFFIRRLTDNNILLHIDLAENKIAQIGDSKYVRITDKLWDYLLQVQQREESASAFEG